MERTFDTPAPISVYVEIGSGEVRVSAHDDTDQTQVVVHGPDADEVVVEQRGDLVLVRGPHKRGGLFSGGGHDLDVTLTLPSGSGLATKLGSADLVATGRYATTRIKSGSGDVQIEELCDEAALETGSGNIRIDAALGEMRVKSGSGDVEVRRLARNAVISTGSGAIHLGTSEGDVVVKSGSGDIRVTDTRTGLTASTASGSVLVGVARSGAVQAKTVSGDVSVGVPSGLPVWTDISCVSGRVTSNLEGAGQPEEGQDFLEIRATTVSGDITLEQR